MVKHPTLAQVMISWCVGSSPALGSVLTAWSLLGILSLFFCFSSAHVLSLSVSLSLSKYINIKKNNTWEFLPLFPQFSYVICYYSSLYLLRIIIYSYYTFTIQIFCLYIPEKINSLFIDLPDFQSPSLLIQSED